MRPTLEFERHKLELLVVFREEGMLWPLKVVEMTQTADGSALVVEVKLPDIDPTSKADPPEEPPAEEE